MLCLFCLSRVESAVWLLSSPRLHRSLRVSLTSQFPLVAFFGLPRLLLSSSSLTQQLDCSTPQLLACLAARSLAIWLSLLVLGCSRFMAQYEIQFQEAEAPNFLRKPMKRASQMDEKLQSRRLEIYL